MKFFPPWLIAPVVGSFYRLWCRTLRFSEEGRSTIDTLWAQKQPLVFALWHDELYPLIYMKKNLEIIAVVSQSRDGEYLARLLEALGVRTARGSSSRGGVKALLQMSKLMRTEGYCACITVDGPRGPRHHAKEGAVFLAHKAHAPIVPIRITMNNVKIFNRAWDKFQLPLPFSSVHIHYGTPYCVEHESLNAEILELERCKLQEKLIG